MNMEKAINLFSSRFAPPGIDDGGEVCVPALTGSANAFAALSLCLPRETTAGKAGMTLAITPGIPEADRLADDLRTLTDSAGGEPYTTRILEFPPRLDDDKTSLGVRLKTIAALRAWSINPYPAVIVASYPALATPIPASAPPPIALGVSLQLDFKTITEKLAQSGYRRVPVVEQPGEIGRASCRERV